MLFYRALLATLLALTHTSLVAAHDGITQPYRPVPKESLLKGEPAGKIVKIGMASSG